MSDPGPHRRLGLEGGGACARGGLAHVKPAATVDIAAVLLDPPWRVEIEVEAVLGQSDGEQPAT
jgi:hypothetical protein